MSKLYLKFDTWISIAALTIVSALAYLPFVRRLGYFNDDWYLMYAGHSTGPSIFWLIYRYDRPGRAPVLGRAYQLFGDIPLFYHLSGYIFRLLSGMAIYWLVSILWPRNRHANLIIALLFLIYPGFLSQTNPIDYQAQLLSLFLATLSIALTAQALQIRSLLWRVLLFCSALAAGWIYLSLVEYFIGLETLRMGVIAIIIMQRNPGAWQKVLKRSILAWLPYSLISVGYLAWRAFFFQNEREATNIGMQLGIALQSPASALERLVQLLKDTIQVIVLAWTVPFHDLVLQLNSSAILTGIGIAAICVLCVLMSLRFLDRDTSDDKIDPGYITDWRLLAIGLGMFSALSALIPVILANRYVDFTQFSRYALASSIGAAMIAAGGLYFMTTRRARYSILSLLVSVAVLTHFANASHKAAQTASMNDFWWQVAWRAPQIQPETLLVAHYPLISIEEDYFVWGPANLIYYPQAHLDDNENTWAPISAVVLTPENLDKIRYLSETQKNFRRGIATHGGYSDLLVLSQNSLASCVHTINGKQPEISTADPAEIQLVAPYSRLDRINVEAEHVTPPPVVFGAEPKHNWCFYYQKADLARQQEDWEEAASLGETAWQNQLAPADSIEYMPFLQAYAILGREFQLQRTIAKLKAQDPLAKERICPLMNGYMSNASTRQILEMELCSP